MRLIILGPPGSGKGTQAVIISRKRGIPHISTGEMFRQSVAAGTELGSEIRQYTATGDLVPDEIVIRVVADRLSQNDCRAAGFIFDGFPRTLAQGKVLNQWMNDEGIPLNHVIDIDVTEEILVKRLTGRRVCEKCLSHFNTYFRPPKKENICDRCGGRLLTRQDDAPESIGHRLEVDAEKTRPLKEYYDRMGLLTSFDGSLDVEPLAESILDFLGRSEGKRD